MRRFPSVKKTSDFLRIYDMGNSLANGCFVMYIYENGLPHNRIGISASKKIGNSVVRHTMVRKVRELFRINNPNSKQGYDIIVVVRKKACFSSFQVLEKSYLDLFNRHHMITERNL